MKNLLLILSVAFTFTAGENFDFAAFLANAKAAGIKLYAESRTDTVNGFVMGPDGDGKVHVTLFAADENIAPKNPAPKRGEKEAGKAALAGNLEDYRAALQAAFDQANP